MHNVLPIFPPGFSPTVSVTEHSGKLQVVCDILHYIFTHTQEKIAIVSNYTQVICISHHHMYTCVYTAFRALQSA